MADNLDFGGGKILATKDVSGVHHPRQILGGISSNSSSNPTAASDLAQVQAMQDKLGRQIVVYNQIRERVVQEYKPIVTANATEILAAGGSGIFLDLTMIVVSNNGVANEFEVRDGSTVVWTFRLAQFGTLVQPFLTPWPQAAPGNAAWNFKAVSGTIDVRVFYQAVANV